MKERLYLDTSVISYLRQEDAPEQRRITNEFWEILKRGEYDVFISDVVLAEIDRNQKEKRMELYGCLNKIEYTEINAKNDTHIESIIIGVIADAGSIYTGTDTRIMHLQL